MSRFASPTGSARLTKGDWGVFPKAPASFTNRYENPAGVVPQSGFMGPKNRSLSTSPTRRPQRSFSVSSFDDGSFQHSTEPMPQAPDRSSSSSQKSLQHRPAFSTRRSASPAGTAVGTRAASPSWEEWRNSRTRKMPPSPPLISSFSPAPSPSPCHPKSHRAESPYRRSAGRQPSNLSPSPAQSFRKIYVELATPNATTKTAKTAKPLAPEPPPSVQHVKERQGGAACDRGDQIIRSLRQSIADGQALADHDARTIFFSIKNASSAAVCEARELSVLLALAWNLALSRKLASVETIDNQYRQQLHTLTDLRNKTSAANQSLAEIDQVQDRLKDYLSKLKLHVSSRAPISASMGGTQNDDEKSHYQDVYAAFLSAQSTLQGVAAPFSPELKCEPPHLEEVDKEQLRMRMTYDTLFQIAGIK